MTTIAWDGKTLAVDRQVTYGNLRRETRKLHDCGEYIYAGAGEQEDVYAIAQWIRLGPPSAVGPEVTDDGCHGLAVHKQTAQVFRVTGKRTTMAREYDAKTVAGSGGHLALAAMDHGKSAADAVEYAARHDVYTGGGVDAMDFPR